MSGRPINRTLRRAFPRLPLVDDGFMRRAHQRGQLRLAQSARAANCANLLVVVTWHAGPGQWRATIIWADRPPIVRSPKRPGPSGSRASPKAAKSGPGVISHWQPPVPRRRPQRLDVHADQEREYGKRKERMVVAMCRQRPRSCEHLRRRRPPPGIPRPIRFGGHTEHGREGRLRLPQRDPALTQRAGLHDVTPCHRRRPPGSAGWRGAYFSQPIFGADRSLCSLHIRRGSRQSERNRRFL